MEWRSLAPNEKSILDRMLQEDFPGRDEIARQLGHALAREIDREGSLEFSVEPDPWIETKYRVPVEAECKDSDGVTIHLLLHVLDGRLSELEIFKEDSSPVFTKPTPHRLHVTPLV